MHTMAAVGVHLINMYRSMKKLMIGILGLSLAMACNSGSSDSEGGNVEAQTSVAAIQEDITVQKAAEMLEAGNVVLVDVRSEDEYTSGHIAGALNVDVNSPGFEEKIASLDKSKKYVVYCHSGRRSAKSSDIMIDNGFVTVYNVLGGISEWKGNGYDVVTE